MDGCVQAVGYHVCQLMFFPFIYFRLVLFSFPQAAPLTGLSGGPIDADECSSRTASDVDPATLSSDGGDGDANTPTNKNANTNANNTANTDSNNTNTAINTQHHHQPASLDTPYSHLRVSTTTTAAAAAAAPTEFRYQDGPVKGGWETYCSSSEDSAFGDCDGDGDGGCDDDSLGNGNGRGDGGGASSQGGFWYGEGGGASALKDIMGQWGGDLESAAAAAEGGDGEVEGEGGGRGGGDGVAGGGGVEEGDGEDESWEIVDAPGRWESDPAYVSGVSVWFTCCVLVCVFVLYHSILSMPPPPPSSLFLLQEKQAWRRLYTPPPPNRSRESMKDIGGNQEKCCP